MKPRWCRELDEAAKKEFTADFLTAHPVRMKLIEMLEEDVEKSLVRMRDGAKGGIPNLTEFYTDELATQRTLSEIIKLLRD